MTSTDEIIKSACESITGLLGKSMGVVEVSRPDKAEDAAVNSRVLSKLSPLLGNLFEVELISFLNDQARYGDLGEWVRQDPGFPDAVFSGSVSPVPGIEFKSWCPLATEITARFRESQNFLAEGNTVLCLLAWMPDRVIYGKPVAVDACFLSGTSVASARDGHYHNPPDYLVVEPEDTATRTRNLRQTNANGLRLQEEGKRAAEAKRLVHSWGDKALPYSPSGEYQAMNRELTGKYKYRLDTNFAKIDRIGHAGIEEFKSRVLGSEMHGKTIKDWSAAFSSGEGGNLLAAAEELLAVK